MSPTEVANEFNCKVFSMVTVLVFVEVASPMVTFPVKETLIIIGP